MGDSGDPFMRNQNAAVQARTKAQNRSNVLQLKLMGQSHPTGLTNNLLKLFEPRPPLEYKPPPEKRKCPPYTGMALFVSNFAKPGDSEYAPPKPQVETTAQKRERVQKLRLDKGVEKAAEDLQKYDPSNDPNATGDPYKTLFVSRLNYESSESKIKREFESYGPIKRVQLVTDQLTNKPRGYAFIEYMHSRDMKAAYKQADGQKIDGRRVLVDVERGRTVPNWRPRRLGGGLGTSRVGGGGETVGEQQQQQQGRTSRSEEPREEREKSREKGKERERERSRELSIEQPRERDHDRPREDKERESRRDRGGRDSRRDRDRNRDRGDRDRRDRDRGRDRTTKDHERNRERKRERDYEGEYEHEGGGGQSREREPEYEQSVSKHHDRDRHGEPEKRRSNYYEDDQGDTDRYSHRYDKMEEDEYRYERDHKGFERSESREIVNKINNSIGQDPDSKNMTGMLDVYGFESFKTNSFEQFCIDLTSEKRQHQKPGGIIALLDEACMFPRSTHETFSHKLYETLQKNQYFSKPKLARTDFTVCHYAGDVTYQTEQFLEKNKDFVVAEHQALLGAPLLSISYSTGRCEQTVKQQLALLIERLSTTEPRYIRCVKPNNLLKLSIFENQNVLQQLRYEGMMEAIEICRAGYPTRKHFDEFLDRFASCTLDKSSDEKAACKKLLEAVGLKGYQGHVNKIEFD